MNGMNNFDLSNSLPSLKRNNCFGDRQNQIKPIICSSSVDLERFFDFKIRRDHGKNFQ